MDTSVCCRQRLFNGFTNPVQFDEENFPWNNFKKNRNIKYFFLDHSPVRDSAPRLRLRVHEPPNGRGQGAQGTTEVQAAGQAGQFLLFGQI
jgi:hypothetical protein